MASPVHRRLARGGRPDRSSVGELDAGATHGHAGGVADGRPEGSGYRRDEAEAGDEQRLDRLDPDDADTRHVGARGR